MKNLVLVSMLFLTSCITQAEYVKPIPDLTGKNPAVMKIYSAYPSGVAECTATLVSERVAITAAHCLTVNNQSPVAVLSSPNYAWGKHPHGLLKVDSIYVEPCYTESRLEDPRCDFGLIVLKTDVPKEIVPMTVAIPFSGKVYEFTGYAGRAHKQVVDSGVIRLFFGLIRSQTLAIGGMSGGPIHEGNELVGVITMGGPLESVGVPITPDRMRLLNKAIKESRGTQESKAEG